MATVIDNCIIFHCLLPAYSKGLKHVYMVFPWGSAGKESACNAGDLGSIPGLEDPLEKGRVTHSSILAWRIPWTSPWGRKESDMTDQLSLSP